MLKSVLLKKIQAFWAVVSRHLLVPSLVLLMLTPGSLEAQLPVSNVPSGYPLNSDIEIQTGEIDTSGSQLGSPLLIIKCEPLPPTGPCCQDFCVYNDPVVADLEATGENIKWYDVPTGGTCLPADVPLVSGHYYATQTVNGYESLSRFDVTVTIIDPETPTGLSVQSFCAVDNPMVEDLEVEGDHVFWYFSAEGGSPISDDLPLIQDTYYAGQTISGCESTARLAVSVLISSPAAPEGPSSQVFCASDNPVIADLEVSGENIRWYSVQEGGSELGPSSSLTTGNYYASQTIDGCESPGRLQVSVDVGATPVTSQVTGKAEPDCYETGLTYSVVLTSGSTYEWTVPDGAAILSGAAGPDNHMITVDFGSKSGSISVTETSSFGCVGSPVELMVTLPECGPVADFSASDTAVCMEQEIIFSDLSEETDENTVYAWDFGPGATPSVAATAGPHTVKYSTPGLKSIQLTVTGIFPNTLIRTDYILVHPDPVVDLGRDTALCGGNSLLLDAGDYVAYEWSTGAVTQNILVYEGAGAVSVIVTDENGCEAGDAIMILNCNPAELLGDIPNIFTPNNDNIHDSWVIRNIHLFPDVTILIYDRWGRLVYEADGGYENDWYGTDPNGNDLPVGTYYYIIDLKIPGTAPIKGTVSILR